MKLKIQSEYNHQGTLQFQVYVRTWWFFWEVLGFPQPDMESAYQYAVGYLERQLEIRRGRPKKKVRYVELVDDRIIWSE